MHPGFGEMEILEARAMLSADLALTIENSDKNCAVTITTLKSKTSGDDGRGTLGIAALHAVLKSFSAGTSDLVGDFIADSTLGSLTLGIVGLAPNVGAQHQLHIGGASVPTVSNGRVYVGTSNSLVIYGLPRSADVFPQTPVLAAQTLSGFAINLTWTDNSVSPNDASGYLIERSTDNVNFQLVATAPAGAKSIAIGALNLSTKYYFRIRCVNAVGNSYYSNSASATTTSNIATIDFSGGFLSGDNLNLSATTLS